MGVAKRPEHLTDKSRSGPNLACRLQDAERWSGTEGFEGSHKAGEAQILFPGAEKRLIEVESLAVCWGSVQNTFGEMLRCLWGPVLCRRQTAGWRIEEGGVWLLQRSHTLLELVPSCICLSLTDSGFAASRVLPTR